MMTTYDANILNQGTLRGSQIGVLQQLDDSQKEVEWISSLAQTEGTRALIQEDRKRKLPFYPTIQVTHFIM